MTADTNDCPAAHSMDTTWFAVDADGNIGVFDSGEAGGVPMGAALGIHPGGENVDRFPLEALRAARVLARGASEIADAGRDVALVVGDRVVVVVDRAEREHPDTDRTFNPGPFETALGESLWVLHEHAPRVIATRAPLDATALEALHSDASVVALLAGGNLYDWLEYKQDTGVFVWENQDYEAAGAYVRIDETRDPIRLDTLPAALRSELSQVRLQDTHFASEASIQLADHFERGEVLTWGDDVSLRPPTEAERAAAAARHEMQRARGARTAQATLIGLVMLLVLAVLLGWLTR